MNHQLTRQKYFEENPPKPSGHTGPAEIKASSIDDAKGWRIIRNIALAVLAIILLFTVYKLWYVPYIQGAATHSMNDHL